jgi:hypothetical protein
MFGTAIGVAALAGFGPDAFAASPDAPSGADEVSVFASAPAPGHPFGIAVEGDRVYVSTSAGDFFADPDNGGHKNSDGERVFTYGLDGELLDTTTVETMPDATMGLFGVALDGNAEPDHHLYVADMNGRILRLDLSQHPATPELFSQTTIEGGWMASMWNDLAFDTAGNLYVPDDKPRIWRVTPDGKASVWLADDRLQGGFPFAGGPLGGRIDPSGEWLYFSITVSGDPAYQGAGLIYRARLVNAPGASDLELVHVFPVTDPATPPQPTGLAFSASGNLYVSLLGPNQIAVLDPSGTETRRISDPRFHSPWGLAFLDDSLLVTNADLEPGDDPDAWKIFRVAVGEPGLPLIQPAITAP